MGSGGVGVDDDMIEPESLDTKLVGARALPDLGLDEMYLASLINKGREAYISGTTNPTVLPSETVLTMATINGAKAVLWDNEIGSLEVGKKADLIVVNPFKWSMLPLHDSIANIVYCMRSENIESVMCNGQWIMKDQKIMNVNEEEMELNLQVENLKLHCRTLKSKVELKLQVKKTSSM
uniref:5-methylthioadenosine/S-adenosylhomocysteine deaminase n=1 Tax=Aegilops tauschii TaxID=37682 RepID=M8AU62_AEGTA